jgi:Protein kinase domain
MNCSTTTATAALSVVMKQQHHQQRAVLTKNSSQRALHHFQQKLQQSQHLQNDRSIFGRQYDISNSGGSNHKCYFSSLNTTDCSASVPFPIMTIVDSVPRPDGQGFNYHHQQQQQQNPNHRWTNEKTAMIVGVAIGVYATTMLTSSSSPNLDRSTHLEKLSTFSPAKHLVTSTPMEERQINVPKDERSVPSTINAIINTTSSNSSNCGSRLSTITVSEPTFTIDLMTNTTRSTLADKYNVDWNTRLGVGAYGSVYPVQSKETGEIFALKKIGRQTTTQSVFHNETDILLQLQTEHGGHPNISRLCDAYEDHDYYYLVMEMIAGGELFDHLVEFGAYDETDAARLMKEISSALSFLHQNGITHMDLKVRDELYSYS